MAMPDSLRLPLPSAHEVEDEPSGAYAVVRPKPIGRPRLTPIEAQASAARLFDQAARDLVLTNTGIARIWGKDESTVRRMRSGEKKLDAALLEMLPGITDRMHVLRTGGADHLAAVRAQVIQLFHMVNGKRGA